MTINIKRKNSLWLLLIILSNVFLSFSQGDTRAIKAQFALGINSPSSSGFVDGFEANSTNFPTINLGVHFLVKPKLFAKLDFGFNRFSNTDNSIEFKTNYSRINAQIVYDFSIITSFSNRVSSFIHAGPGLTAIKPLGNYGANKTAFLNTMAGIEFHYGISDKFSIYIDTSYIMGHGKEFSPISEGFGSFNGDLLTITFGASISLSGCYYCGD